MAFACVAALVLAPAGVHANAEELVEASALLTLTGRDVAVVVGDDNTRGLWLVELGSLEPRRLSWPKSEKAKSKEEKKEKTEGKKNVALDDLEALAGLGSGDATEFLAVTSHSRNKNGALKPARSRMARIRLAEDSRSIRAVDVYSDLREPLLASLAPLLNGAAREAAAEKTSEQGGLDVEAAASWRGKLLLGLRSPGDRHGLPIVAVLEDPASLFESLDARPKFLRPLVVPARAGEAIRGMSEHGDEVLMILSARASGKESYRVVRWDPASNALRDVKLDGVMWAQPEGISLADDGTLWFAQDLEAGARAGAQALVACRPRNGATDAQAGGADPPACVLSTLLE